MNVDATCAIILAGGRGTRIRHLHPHIPKPFIAVAGRPFIEWVMTYLAQQGYGHMIVSLGHLASVALPQLVDLQRRVGCTVTPVVEAAELGTGGALLFALQQAGTSDPILVTNGDSLVLADLGQARRLLNDSSVDGVIVAAEVADAGRFGTLRVDDSGFLEAFEEKVPGRGLINAGVYLFRRALLAGIHMQSPFSLEHDVLPNLACSGARVAVYASQGPFMDMGTPEGLQEAGRLLSNLVAQGEAL